MKDLEGKVKHPKDSALIGQLTNKPHENYTFYFITSQVLHAHTNKTEWIVDSGCTHHMEKDASLLASLSGAPEEKIYVIDDYTLTIYRNGDVECHHGHIFDVYHVLSLSTNLFSFV